MFQASTITIEQARKIRAAATVEELAWMMNLIFVVKNRDFNFFSKLMQQNQSNHLDLIATVSFLQLSICEKNWLNQSLEQLLPSTSMQ